MPLPYTFVALWTFSLLEWSQHTQRIFVGQHLATCEHMNHCIETIYKQYKVHPWLDNECRFSIFLTAKPSYGYRASGEGLALGCLNPWQFMNKSPIGHTISALSLEKRKFQKYTNSGIVFKHPALLLKLVVLTSHGPLPVTPNSTWRCKGVRISWQLTEFRPKKICY